MIKKNTAAFRSLLGTLPRQYESDEILKINLNFTEVNTYKKSNIALTLHLSMKHMQKRLCFL